MKSQHNMYVKGPKLSHTRVFNNESGRPPIAAVLKRRNYSTYCGSFLKHRSRISIAAI